MIEANPRFLRKQAKKNALSVLCQKRNVTRIKLGPYRNLSAISPTRNVVCMYAHTPMHTAEIWKQYRVFFYFLKASLSLNRDKYFALYWCFCVKISFILLLIKWSEMDPNAKPQTLVETFDRANSILSQSICHGSHNFVGSTCKAERSFSGMKRLQTPLQRTMTDERLSSLSLSLNMSTTT